MTAPAVFTSNLAQWQKDHAAAVDKALFAAAEVLQAEIKRRLRRGYTSGAFVGPDADPESPGTLADSVIISPITTEKGARVIRVGSTDPVAIAWEVGHLNIFTDRFERVEHFRDAVLAKQRAIASMFAVVYRGEMRKWDSQASVRSVQKVG